MSEQILDCVGVPEFFYTTVGKTEHAGGDCVRIYCCIEREGHLVPQLTVVMPAECVLTAAQRVREAALDIYNRDMALHGAH